jgi:hypothetical protein
MSCALSRRDEYSTFHSPPIWFDDHRSSSICDKLLSLPDGLSGKIASSLRKLDRKLGKFLIKLTAEIERVQRSQSAKQDDWRWNEDGENWIYKDRNRLDSRHHRSHHGRSRSRCRDRISHFSSDKQIECPKSEERQRSSTRRLREGSSTRQIVDGGHTARELPSTHSSDGVIATPFLPPLRVPVPASDQRFSSDHLRWRDMKPPRPATESTTTLWQNINSQPRSRSQSRTHGIPSHSISSRTHDQWADPGRQVRQPSQAATTSRHVTSAVPQLAINRYTGISYRLLPASRHTRESSFRSCLDDTGHNPNRVSFKFDEAQAARLTMPKTSVHKP